MKTTIEINGFEIHIEQDGDIVEIEVLRGGEVVDEMKLDAADFGESAQGQGETSSEEAQSDDVKSFDEFGQAEEEDDFDGAEEFEDEDEDEDELEDEMDSDDFGDDEEDTDDENEMEDEEPEHKLESFQAFINKSNSKNRKRK